MADERPPIRVFVSYSRRDEKIVTPIVEVIRAVGVDAFRDRDNIPYGSNWRLVIEESIGAASKFLVFWCWHSRGSQEVARESRQAIERGLDILPALLDNAPIESPLGDYQAVDLRTLPTGHQDPDDEEPLAVRSRRRRGAVDRQQTADRQMTTRIERTTLDDLISEMPASNLAARLLIARLCS